MQADSLSAKMQKPRSMRGFLFLCTFVSTVPRVVCAGLRVCSYNQITMFRRLLALWSLLSLLLASGPVFAGGLGVSSAFVESAHTQLVDAVLSNHADTESQTDPETSTNPVLEVEPSLDPMDWPEGIELLGILARASLLSHAVVPHHRHAMPSPCLATLQRPPSARA